MKTYDRADEIQKLIEPAKHVLIIQADNPDGDSLASALALEEILGDYGKEVSLYCSVDVPGYLRHLDGWDRVNSTVPTNFDLSIIVDTSALLLLEKLEKSEARNWVASKPVIVLDHHDEVVCDIPYAGIVINDGQAVATGEVIYFLANQLDWPLNLRAKSHLASSILADSLGLSSVGTTADTYRIMADLVESGVDRAKLEEARRALSKMPEEIFHYKARLIERTELHADGRIAIVSIPHDELMTYSPLYNPAPLIQNDMLQVEGVLMAVVLKAYHDGKVTGSIRCNSEGAIAADLAKIFGGGGHAYASGFKTTTGKPIADTKSTLVAEAIKLLDQRKGQE